jgi:hypothetical protein
LKFSTHEVEIDMEWLFLITRDKNGVIYGDFLDETLQIIRLSDEVHIWLEKQLLISLKVNLAPCFFARRIDKIQKVEI